MTSEEKLVDFVIDRVESIMEQMNREGNISFETKDEIEEWIDNLYNCLSNMDING